MATRHPTPHARLVMTVAGLVAGASLAAPGTAGAAEGPRTTPVDRTVSAVPSTFHALPATRFLDTRTGHGAAGPLGPGDALTVTVPVPFAPGDGAVQSVVLNVTVTQPAAAGHVTVYASGQERPATSNLNFSRGQTVANLVTTRIRSGSRGAQADFYNGSSGSLQLVAELVGYFSDDTSGSTFHPSTPTRVLDTRSGSGAPRGAVAARGTLLWSVPGLPADATAVVLTLTATAETAAGHLTVTAGDESPQWSNLNFAPQRTIANQVVVALDASRRVRITNASVGSVQVLADLAGYYVPQGAESYFYPTTAARVLDTRDGTGQGEARSVAPGERVNFLLPMPYFGPGATAVTLNVTVTQPSAGGHVTVVPYGTDGATTSDVNFGSGQTIAAHVLVSMKDPGTYDDDRANVSFVNSSRGRIQLLVDASGWFHQGYITAESAPVEGSQDVPRLLAAVDCPPGGPCVAVGDYLDPHESAAGFIYQTRDDFSQDAAAPSDAAINPKAQFHDVSCPRAGWCAAVQTYTTNTGHVRAAADIIAADAPQTPDLPVPTGATDADVEKVSCGAERACAAVGTFTGGDGVARALLETLSTTGWSATTAPLPTGADPAAPSVLTDVSCPSSNFCVAVGRRGASPDVHPVLDVYSGGSWTAVAPPEPAAGSAAQLTAVDCVSDTYCVAQGYDWRPGSDPTDANEFTYFYDGSSWTVQQGAASGLPSSGEQGAIACAAPGSCLAAQEEEYVHDAIGDDVTYAVLTQLTGSTWHRIGYPLPPDYSPADARGNSVNFIDGPSPVSCPSPTSCVVVGNYQSIVGGSHGYELAQQSGTSWPLTQLPEPLDAASSPHSHVNAVACSAPGTCVAVGQYEADDGQWHALVEGLNGLTG